MLIKPPEQKKMTMKTSIKSYCGKLQEGPCKLQNKHVRISFHSLVLIFLSVPSRTIQAWRNLFIYASYQSPLCSLASVIKQSGRTAWFFLLARGRALLPTAQERAAQRQRENDYLKLQTSLSLSFLLLKLETSVLHYSSWLPLLLHFFSSSTGGNGLFPRARF